MRPGSFRNGRPTLAVIIRCFFRVFWHSGGGEGGGIGRRTSLRSWRREACGFESLPSHQLNEDRSRGRNGSQRGNPGNAGAARVDVATAERDRQAGGRAAEKA